MKRLFLFLLPVVAIVMASCDKWESASSSPILQTSPFLIRSSVEGKCDTLYNFSDTICVGDTMRLGLAVDAYYNALLSVQAKTDADKVSVSLAWDKKNSKDLASDADPEHGLLTFVPKRVRAITTVLTYIPQKAGNHNIAINVSSDAGPEYSPRNWSFGIVVK